MLGAPGMSLADLEDDYVFVRLGDLISLTFCTGWTDEQCFGSSTIQLSGWRVVVPRIRLAGRPFRSRSRRGRCAIHRIVQTRISVQLAGKRHW